MVNNNKILTVSYGTFSCTLEGFDDSFGTMKAIAEYFRDLAADDRYFGAEPPQPDAEMLARIAEREIARQVEARSDDQGIVLRASEYQAPAALAAASAAIVETQVEPTAPVSKPEPVAAPEPAAVDVDVEDIDATETEIAPTDAEQSDFVSEPESVAVAEPVTEEQPDAETVDADPAAESIASKLQRIRAVVSKAPALEDDDEDISATDDFVADTVSDLSLALQEDDALADAENEPFEIAADQELADAFSKFDSVDDAQAEDDEAGYDENYEDATADDDDVLSFLAAVQDDVTDAEVEDDAEEPLTSIGVNSDDLDDIEADEAAAEYEDRGDNGLFSDLTDDETPEAEVASDIDLSDDDELVNILGTDIASSDAEDQVQSSLSDEEEAELMAELAEVEAEQAAEDTIDLEDDQDLEPVGNDMNGAAILKGSDEPDDDMSRLMAAADEKLDSAESSTSRATYSHLRAAVAAAEAQRSAGQDIGGEIDDDAYREDLADVVGEAPVEATPTQRPGRPPSEDRPAPLKLVAEQRVDIDAPSNIRGPVRPRRVSASELDAAYPAEDADNTGGFAEYAQRMGATELPDLLEAAASYLSFIEGCDQFSRPQLMSKVRQVESQDFSREDGLRSFGQLLRQGKIQRQGGGRFSASGNIGFRPDEREAG